MKLVNTRYNIVSKDWKLIDTIRLDSAPQQGHHIFILKELRYFTVVLVVHNPSAPFLVPTTTIVVEPTTKIDTDES